MFATMRRSHASGTISFKVKIAPPSTFFAFRPRPSPLSVHTGHVGCASHFSPVIFAVGVTSHTGRDHVKMVTWRHHFVLEGLWPVDGAHLGGIVVEFRHSGRDFFDSRGGKGFVVFPFGGDPNFVSMFLLIFGDFQTWSNFLSSVPRKRFMTFFHKIFFETTKNGFLENTSWKSHQSFFFGTWFRKNGWNQILHT